MTSDEKIDKISSDVAVLLERSDVALQSRERHDRRIRALEEKVSNITGRLVMAGVILVTIASLAQPLLARLINGEG